MSGLDWQRARDRDAAREDRPMRGPSWRDLPATAAQLRALDACSWRIWGGPYYRSHGFTRGQASDLLDAWNRPPRPPQRPL